MSIEDSERLAPRRRLSDEVADRLRTMILSGRITTDDRLTQDDLASRLGVSTTPVREALLRLSVEGFVRVLPNRSFELVPVRDTDIRDVYWMASVLMGELAYRACDKADDDLISQLNDLEREHERARQRQNLSRLWDLNWKFHRAINLAAESPKILVTLGAALRFIPRNFYELAPAWHKSAGHASIIAAFEAKDPDAARLLSAAHMRDAGEALVAHYIVNG